MHQLTRHQGLKKYGDQVLRAIIKDQTIFEQQLGAQLEALILGPLRTIYDECDLPTLPKVVIIDGVDEVEALQYHDPTRQDVKRAHEDDQLEILSTLLRCAEEPAFPFRILIASRPECTFEDFFAIDAQPLTCKVFLGYKYGPDADIELFLKVKFAEIRRRYRLSSAWPAEEAIRWIVDKASGQFIFAATVVRFVSETSYLPQLQLEQVLQLNPVQSWNKNPFGPLDSLYRRVISNCPNPELAVKWIGSIEKYSGKTPAHSWRRLLETIEGESDYVLGNLSSLIWIPPLQDLDSPFQLYHKSLFDFLSDKTRCGDLYVDPQQWGTFCAEGSIRVLKSG